MKTLAESLHRGSNPLLTDVHNSFFDMRHNDRGQDATDSSCSIVAELRALFIASLAFLQAARYNMRLDSDLLRLYWRSNRRRDLLSTTALGDKDGRLYGLCLLITLRIGARSFKP